MSLRDVLIQLYGKTIGPRMYKQIMSFLGLRVLPDNLESIQDLDSDSISNLLTIIQEIKGIALESIEQASSPAIIASEISEFSENPLKVLSKLSYGIYYDNETYFKSISRNSLRMSDEIARRNNIIEELRKQKKALEEELDLTGDRIDEIKDSIFIKEIELIRIYEELETLYQSSSSQSLRVLQFIENELIKQGYIPLISQVGGITFRPDPNQRTETGASTDSKPANILNLFAETELKYLYARPDQIGRLYSALHNLELLRDKVKSSQSQMILN